MLLCSVFCPGDQIPWKILAKEFIFNKVLAFNFVYHTLTQVYNLIMNNRTAGWNKH